MGYLAQRNHLRVHNCKELPHIFVILKINNSLLCYLRETYISHTWCSSGVEATQRTSLSVGEDRQSIQKYKNTKIYATTLIWREAFTKKKYGIFHNWSDPLSPPYLHKIMEDFEKYLLFYGLKKWNWIMEFALLTPPLPITEFSIIFFFNEGFP